MYMDESKADLCLAAFGWASASGLDMCLMGFPALLQDRRAADACGTSTIAGQMRHTVFSHIGQSKCLKML